MIIRLSANTSLTRLPVPLMICRFVLLPVSAAYDEGREKAVSAPGLQGGGSRKRSVYATTPFQVCIRFS